MNKRIRKKQIKKQNKWAFVNKRETYELVYVVADFILPRLRLFRKTTFSYPENYKAFPEFEEWLVAIDKMIFAFEFAMEHKTKRYQQLCEEEIRKFEDDYKKYEEGMELFGKWFLDLWI